MKGQNHNILIEQLLRTYVTESAKTGHNRIFFEFLVYNLLSQV